MAVEGGGGARGDQNFLDKGTPLFQGWHPECINDV